MNRRRFLHQAGLSAAALAIPGALLADPYAPLPRRAGGKPVRVRGAVRSAGKGLARVAVSDGLTTVETAADGSYELLTSASRAHVQICVPAGYRIPVNATGTARFYAPLAPTARGEASASFDLEPLPVSDQNHAVIMLGDIQTQDADEMRWFHEQSVPDVIATRQALGELEVVGISCGDIMYDDLTLFPEYERGVSRMGVPFFQVVGNHDLDFDSGIDEDSTRTFVKHFGPRYYSFDRGAVHYVVLDNVFWQGSGYLGYLDWDQLAWLEGDLARVERGRPVVVALHIPAQGSMHRRRGDAKPTPNITVTNRELLFRLLEPYKAHVVAGHMHESEHAFFGSIHEHVCGAICGAWWSGPICADGTPNGYALYEARGEEITWRAKSTGHDAGYQVRVHPHGADKKAPDEIVANVWDWDPAWQVVWYENGERRGAMARRTGHDPLSLELHKGDDKPERRKWVEPYPTDHLFYAPAARNAEILVEVTDRFGRVSKSALTTGAKG